MRRVALISQTLRAQHCHAYMNDGSEEGVILTSNPSAFADFEFDTSTLLIAVNPPAALLPAAHLVQTRIFRSALERARSGSRFGASLERMVKWLARRLRHQRRLGPLGRHRHPQEMDELSIRHSAMYAKLEEQHRSSRIDQLVVFDVFDLPVALAFAEDYHIELLVR